MKNKNNLHTKNIFFYENVDLSGLSAGSREAMITHIIEGMIPDPELIATLRLVDAGKIDLQEFVKREVGRIDTKRQEATNKAGEHTHE
jgi:hypothetical protein